MSAPARQRLANRRGADVVAFTHANREWSLTVGRFDDGRVAEIFIDASKIDQLSDMAKEAAILVSLALQSGCSIETLRQALSDRDAGPIATGLALVDDASPKGL